MNKKTILIGCGALLFLCIAVSAVGVVIALFATQPTANVGDDFMTALQSSNYDKAYELLHPALQKKVGTSQDLEQMIEKGKVHPVKWSFSSRSIENDTGELDGSATFTGNREGTVQLSLQKAGSDWKIIAFNLQEN